MKNAVFCMALLIGLYGCKDDSGGPATLTKALVVYTGEPEVDGCGYMLRIDGEEYKPLNLPAHYQQDSLELAVAYEQDPSGFLCGDLTHPVPTIHLTEMHTR